MKYLIITPNHEPYYTKWFDYCTHYDPNIGMIVFDIINHTHTYDGINWEDTIKDHL